jgi:thymidine phosphorylase
MRAIIAAQGARAFDHQHPALGALTFDVRAAEPGVVTGIDNLQIAQIARLAGAPKVKGAGVDLMRKLGEPVAVGDVLYRVYASYPADLEFARQASARTHGFSIGSVEQVPHVFVEF